MIYKAHSGSRLLSDIQGNRELVEDLESILVQASLSDSELDGLAMEERLNTALRYGCRT